MQQQETRGRVRPWRWAQGAALVALAVGLASCGGGGGSGGGSTGYTVGGTLAGLASGGAVALQLNGAGELALSANGSYQFSTTLAKGAAYAVTVKTQPSGQTCTVTNGSGTLASAAVTNVAVQCTDNPTATGLLPDSGITASQCYAAGSDDLVSCTSPEALALNPAQDGMTGRDVASPDATDGKLGFSYTKIAADGASLPASASTWACVKDNITGLMWEVKTADGGLRDVNNEYTNFDSTTEAQYYDGPAWVPPTQAQIDAATNTVGYVAAVNAAGLCGKKDWRLPTVDELQGLVDYGVDVRTSKPMIDETYFPNTASYAYWTSSPVVGDSNYAWHSGYAWHVSFSDGYVIYGYLRNLPVHVRLVR